MIKLSFSTSQREMAAFLFISVNYSHYKLQISLPFFHFKLLQRIYNSPSLWELKFIYIKESF